MRPGCYKPLHRRNGLTLDKMQVARQEGKIRSTMENTLGKVF